LPWEEEPKPEDTLEIIALIKETLGPRMPGVWGTHLRPHEDLHRVTDKDWQRLEKLFAEEDGRLSHTMFYGPGINLDDVRMTMPYAFIKSDVGSVYFNISIAHDDEDGKALLIERIWPFLRECSPIYAYMNYGYTPNALAHTLPMTEVAKVRNRYRTAPALADYGYDNMIACPEFFAEWCEDHGHPSPIGIHEIGWRTLLGTHYEDRLDQLDLSGIPGVTAIRTPGQLEIVIGDAPFWGDVNQQEDISAWREVHERLKPVRISEHWCHNATPLDKRTDAFENYFWMWYDR